MWLNFIFPCWLQILGCESLWVLCSFMLRSWIISWETERWVSVAVGSKRVVPEKAAHLFLLHSIFAQLPCVESWQSTFCSFSKLPNQNNVMVTPYHCDVGVAGHGPGCSWAWAFWFFLPVCLLCRVSVLNTATFFKSKANRDKFQHSVKWDHSSSTHFLSSAVAFCGFWWRHFPASSPEIF